MRQSVGCFGHNMVFRSGFSFDFLLFLLFNLNSNESLQLQADEECYALRLASSRFRRMCSLT